MKPVLTTAEAEARVEELLAIVTQETLIVSEVDETEEESIDYEASDEYSIASPDIDASITPREEEEELSDNDISHIGGCPPVGQLTPQKRSSTNSDDVDDDNHLPGNGKSRSSYTPSKRLKPEGWRPPSQLPQKLRKRSSEELDDEESDESAIGLSVSLVDSTTKKRQRTTGDDFIRGDAPSTVNVPPSSLTFQDVIRLAGA